MWRVKKKLLGHKILSVKKLEEENRAVGDPVLLGLFLPGQLLCPPQEKIVLRSLHPRIPTLRPSLRIKKTAYRCACVCVGGGSVFFFMKGKGSPMPKSFSKISKEILVNFFRVKKRRFSCTFGLCKRMLSDKLEFILMSNKIFFHQFYTFVSTFSILEIWWKKNTFWCPANHHPSKTWISFLSVPHSSIKIFSRFLLFLEASPMRFFMIVLRSSFNLKYQIGHPFVAWQTNFSFLGL